MPHILNVTESDVDALDVAARSAQQRGCVDLALTLDRLARKGRAGLLNAESFRLRQRTAAQRGLTWKDVPSVLSKAADA